MDVWVAAIYKNSRTDRQLIFPWKILSFVVFIRENFNSYRFNVGGKLWKKFSLYEENLKVQL